MKTRVTRHLESINDGPMVILGEYTGEGELAPMIEQMDRNSFWPGESAKLYVYREGEDEDGDQNCDRYRMYGVETHYWTGCLITKGFVIGDGLHSDQIKWMQDSTSVPVHLEKWYWNAE